MTAPLPRPEAAGSTVLRLVPQQRTPWTRARVGECAFDALSLEQVVAHVLGELAAGRGGTVVTPNLDILRQCAGSARLRELVDAASLRLPDGAPVVWAARLAGQPLYERVPGSDLVPALTAAAGARGHRVFLLGGGPGVADAAAAALGVRLPPDLQPAAFTPGHVPAFSELEVARVAAAVRRSGARIVFVGLGFPKQDLLIAQLAPHVGPVWLFGVGASLDFESGAVRRAPALVRRLGCEWAFRLLLEPRRLARRYLVDGLPYGVRLMLASRRQLRPPLREGTAAGP